MKKLIVGILVASTALMAGGNILPSVALVTVTEEASPFYVGVFGSYDLNDAKGTVTKTPCRKARCWKPKEVEYKNKRRYDVGVQAGWEFYRSGGFTAALEGRISYGVGSNHLRMWNEGIYLKPGYDFENGLGVYGLIGWNWRQLKMDVPDGCLWSDGSERYRNHSSSFSYGGGVKYKVTKHVEVFVDVLRDRKKVAIPGGSFRNDRVMAGLTYKF